MKIAVYTIALNEEKFVERWYNSAKDADYLLIADTGSTDKTKKIAKKLGIKVIDISVKPWRFDDARNAALAALPDDIDMCVSLDMDEELSEGWREHLEKTTATQITYRYTFTWRDKDMTIPQTIFPATKIHARHGYRWKYLIHELPLPDRNPNHTEEFSELEIYHKADWEKPRDSYHQMVEDAYKENPDSDRYAMYYYRTLFATGRIEETIAQIKKYLKMKSKSQTWKSDFSTAYITLAICDPKNAVKHLKSAMAINPTVREPIVNLAIHYFNKEKWRKCEKYCKKALAITVRTLDHSYGEYAWGYLPKNMLAVSSHNKWLNKLSKKYNDEKWKMNVSSPISSNFELFKD